MVGLEGLEGRPPRRSDFDSLYSSSARRYALAAASLVAFVTPCTDTIYLPALTSVEQDLNSSAAAVTATVSVYLAASAVGQLVNGPITDYYGRSLLLFSSFVLYLGLTIGCVFVTTLDQLLVLRTLQGLLVTGTLVPAQAVIADVFAPAERGAAMGIFFSPLLLGPIVAPALGGFLSKAYNWRATFVFLAAIAVPIAGFAKWALPETHPWYVARRLNNNKEGEEGKEEVWESAPLALSSPFDPLRFLVDQDLSPYFLSIGTTFCAMFVSLTLLPLFLSRPPYSLSSDMVGLCYLPSGISMLIASNVGGRAADLSAKRFPNTPDGRMTLLLPYLWSIVPGCVWFGFALEQGEHLAAVLVAHSLLCFGQAALMPSTLSFLSSSRPAFAGQTGAALMFICFGGSAATISVSVVIIEAVGVGYFFLISAVIVALGAAVTTLLNLQRVFGYSAATPLPQTEDAAVDVAAADAHVNFELVVVEETEKGTDVTP